MHIYLKFQMKLNTGYCDTQLNILKEKIVVKLYVYKIIRLL